MTVFVPKGHKRFKHQKDGLKKLISTGGQCALLFDPGLGKTATVLDYVSILALKSPDKEVRVLVVAPLAAVDTWVMQSEEYIHDDVKVWAEALGGSIRARAQALAARGGNPFKTSPLRGPRDTWIGPRAVHWDKSRYRYIRGGSGVAVEGPDGLGTDKPRVILEVINIDTLSQRAAVCRCHLAGKCPDKRRRTITIADGLVEAIRRYDPHLVVVDESHKIKGPGANASRLMARTTDFVKRRVLLTGTVMPHSPLDVFAQWRFMAPYAFGEKQRDGSVKKATYGNFKSRFAKLGGWMGKEVIGFQNLDELQNIMAENAVVARKEDALDLPPLTRITVPVLLSAAEKQAYKNLANDLYVDLPTGRVTVDNWLTQSMRLRQITSGHMPNDDGVLQIIGQSKVQSIRSLCYDTLTSEKRIVIFCLFRPEINMLAEALKSKPGEPVTEVLTVSGGTKVADRIAMRQRFGSDAPERLIMVAQVKTMSLAVNELVTSAHAIFGSLSQQRDDLIQAIDRINRLGQKRAMTVWLMIAPGTVDEVILKSHNDRTSLENAMLKHIQQVHDGGIDPGEANQHLVAEAMTDALAMFMG